MKELEDPWNVCGAVKTECEKADGKCPAPVLWAFRPTREVFDYSDAHVTGNLLDKRIDALLLSLMA